MIGKPLEKLNVFFVIAPLLFHSMAGLREAVAVTEDTVSDLVADLEEAALVIADEVSSARISALAEDIGRHNSVTTHARLHSRIHTMFGSPRSPPIDVWSSGWEEAALAENISSGQRFPDWSFIQTELTERPERRLADVFGRLSPTITTPSPVAHLAKLAVQASITNKDTCPVSLSAIEEEEYALVPLCGHVCGPMAASLTACPTCRMKTGWTRVEKHVAPATGGGSAVAPKPTDAVRPLTITVYVQDVTNPKNVTIKLPVTATIADLEKEYMKAENISDVFSSSMRYHTASSPMSYIPKGKTLAAAGIQAWSTVYCQMNLRGD